MSHVSFALKPEAGGKAPLADYAVVSVDEADKFAYFDMYDAPYALGRS